FRELWKLSRIVIARMLNNSFPHFECQVQSAKCCIALFEILDDSQRVQVVIKEKSVPPHGTIERFLSGVTEWKMTGVVTQSWGLGITPPSRVLHLDSVGSEQLTH